MNKLLSKTRIKLIFIISLINYCCVGKYTNNKMSNRQNNILINKRVSYFLKKKNNTIKPQSTYDRFVINFKYDKYGPYPILNYYLRQLSGFNIKIPKEIYELIYHYCNIYFEEGTKTLNNLAYKNMIFLKSPSIFTLQNLDKIEKTSFIFCDFSNVNFKKTIFENCDFYKSNWSNCKIENSQFQKCTLNYVNFENANLKTINFATSELSNINFSNSSLDNTVFTFNKLKNVIFKNNDFSEVIFTDHEILKYKYLYLELDSLIYTMNNRNYTEAPLNGCKFINIKNLGAYILR